MAEAKQTFGGALGQVGEFIRGLSMRQRITLVGGAAVVAVTLFVFVRLASSPEMKPLYSGMNPTEAQALGARLAAKNIKYEISADGSSVSVPVDQLETSRLEVASQAMPRSGRMGFELFDKPNWGGSDFSEKVNYQRALEGELEHTIETLNDVEAARVHLVLPADSIFAEREHEAKAAVILKLRSGRLPAPTQVAIARLVAGSVDKLRAENVTVVDAETNRPLSLQQGEEDSGLGLDDRLAARLVRTIEPIAGEQRVRATVRLEYDLSSSEESQESYDPEKTVALAVQRSEQRSGGTLPSGVPGTSSNVPNATGAKTTAATADDASQSSHSENSTFAVNKLTRHTINPAGRVKRIAAALLIDDAVDVKFESGKRLEAHRKRTPEEMKQIEDLARAAIGFDATRGDVLSVQNIGFQSDAVEPPLPPTRTEKVRSQLKQWSSVLRYGVVLLLFVFVYLLVLRPVKKQLVLSLNQLPAKAERKAVAGATIGDRELLEGEAAPDLKRMATLKRDLVTKVKTEPAANARLIQSWIGDGGGD